MTEILMTEIRSWRFFPLCNYLVMLCFQTTNIEIRKFAFCGKTHYVQANNKLGPVFVFLRILPLYMTFVLCNSLQNFFAFFTYFLTLSASPPKSACGGLTKIDITKKIRPIIIKFSQEKSNQSHQIRPISR